MTQLQSALLRLLDETARICEKHGISYMLFDGTLLGAVRNGGFIPWDDDADIVMLRPEYERFLAVAEKELDPGLFFLQKEYSPHWPMPHSKLRLQNTTAIEKYDPKDRLSHRGVFIDIFPCDNLSDNALARRIQYLCSRMLIARGLYLRGYETKSPLKIVFMLFSRLMPRELLIKAAILRGNTETGFVHTFFANAKIYRRRIFPREYFTGLASADFEGKRFSVSESSRELLGISYGDYMKLPTQKERGEKRHCVFIDLKRDCRYYDGISYKSFCGGKMRNEDSSD